MRKRILAALLSAVLVVGCIDEVSYAATVSVDIEENQENTEDSLESEETVEEEQDSTEDSLEGEGDVEEEQDSTEDSLESEETVEEEQDSTEDSLESGEKSVPLEKKLTESDQEFVSVDISDDILQQGGLLPDTGEKVVNEYEVQPYQTIDEENYKVAEEALLSAYDSFASECDLSEYQILVSDIGGFIRDVLNTHPRYFYVSGGFSYCCSGDYVARIIINYKYTQDVAQPMLEAFDDAVELAVEDVDQSWSEMEKALYINDYLARNCEYDTTYSEEFRYTAYGVLVEKVAVCQGYALAYVVLADKVGLNCEVVTSDSVNHAWNMIEVNDNYYQVDSTWNDPTNDRIGRSRHIHFMKSTAHFQTTDGTYSTHLKDDDWQVTGEWDESLANDTTYDGYFWNSVDVGFDYVGGNWYGFDGSAISRFSCNGVDFAQEEALKTITDIWYVWGSTSRYWQGLYVGVAAFDNNFYYSTKTAIYQLNLNDNTSSLVYELTNDEKTAGYMYGMHIAPTGEIFFALSTSPNESGTKKQATLLQKNESKYNISFDGNGANSGTMTTMSDLKYGTSYSLDKNEFERIGYEFAGWNTEADGSGIAYADESSVRNLTKEDGSTVILYAQWTAETYNITYQLDGGKNSDNNPATYSVDTATITLEEATKEGYTFGGWYADARFTQPIAKIENGSTGNITLYAKWSIKKYSIAFDRNNANSGTMTAMYDLEYGTSYSLDKNEFERIGYEFAGWNTEADGSGIAYADEASVSNLTTENGATITLYAQWAREKFNITYILDGGENNSSNPAEYTVDTETIILKNAVKKGYLFDGWYVDEAYTQQVTEITKGSTGSVILYAKWTVIKYNVAFEGNGANEGSMTTLVGREYSKSYGLPANTFKYKGYEFAGWNTKRDGSGTSYVDKATILNLADVDGSTVTLYAQWRKITYSITYQLNGGQNSGANPTTYNVTTPTILLHNPVRTGYTFKGWYTDKRYSTQISTIRQGNIGNITLYAKWSANKYSIVFNSNNATSGTMTSLIDISYGESIKLPVNGYERSGYMFIGWNTKANGTGTSYENQASIQNLTTENGAKITLYAQWKMNYINKKKTTIYVGSSETLKLTGTNIKSVSTSNKKVATVTSKGKVTAKKAGKAIITLKGKDGKIYKCTVTVKNPTINAKKKTLKVGKKFTLKLTGTTIKSARSSNKKVATVTSKGIVTAKGKGKATITLKGKDKKSYKCIITVK